MHTSTAQAGSNIPPRNAAQTASSGPPTAMSAGRLAPRFANAAPPPAADIWQAVPEWATWLTLGLCLSIVAVLLGAIVYLLG
jgi:hypothetical protein